ncbi:MAG: hypothetical protein KGJ84_03345 [Elusimicrobia bacterium]|nr:hypothetical protein [Elusimicrobiota bacterium]
MKGLWTTVRALRVRAGYSSARAFHGAWRRQGAGVCSYQAYCDIEAGRLIPSPPLAVRLASALSVRPGTRQAEEFRGAYLFSSTRSRSLSRVLLQSLRPDIVRANIAERMMNVGMACERHVLTAEQRRLLLERPEAVLSFIVLHTIPRAWTTDGISSALGLSAADVRAALRRLAATGLARRWRGAYTCPQAERTLVFPRPTQAERESFGRSFFSGLPSGPWGRQHVVLFRASHDGARRIARQAESMAAAVRALHRRSGAGGMFSVGSFVWRIS